MRACLGLSKLRGEGKGRVWLLEGTKGSFLRQYGLIVNKIGFGGRGPCKNPKCYQTLTVSLVLSESSSLVCKPG